MDANPFAGLGLRPVTLADQTTLSAYFGALAEPLSDYTFSQLFTWSRGLRIFWRLLDGHLCVFANGSGDLTMLLPPLGEGNSDRALASAYEIMDAYNGAMGTPQRGRVEYASDELLRRFDRTHLEITPLAVDYLYDTSHMIDLPGGDLASKRQAKNRFMRNYAYHVERYDPARHLESCRTLLHGWKQYQDHQHESEGSTNMTKRATESLACEAALEYANDLHLNGLVVFVNEQQPAGERPREGDGWSVRGFTFGEALGASQASIIIEKTDLQVKGLAQFIFSEFCRTAWSDKPVINVGDDWGLETLAWTKRSYRPVGLLQKSTFRRQATVMACVPASFHLAPMAAEVAAAPIPQVNQVPAATMVVSFDGDAIEPSDVRNGDVLLRRAQPADLSAAISLEARCFQAYSLKKRQLQYLQRRNSSIFLVAETEGHIVGEGIGLLRRHKQGVSGRIYSLVVDPQSRGKRIGQRLLRAMIGELLERGARRIYLEVEASNQVARRLYEQNGFRSIGVLENYYGTGFDGLHMVYETIAQRNVTELEPAALSAT